MASDGIGATQTYRIEGTAAGTISDVAKVEAALIELAKLPGVRITRFSPYTPKAPRKEAKG